MADEKLKNELREMIDKSITHEIKSVQFRNKRTGEVATQIPLFEMDEWENVEAKKPKPKKPNPNTAKFSEMLQYQIDLQNWKRLQRF